MTNRSTPSSRSSRRRGLTLIEVVAALAIMGSLLVGVLLSRASHTRQLAESRRRQAAVVAADALLAAWWSSAEGVPTGASGTLPGDDTLSWETHVVANAAAEGLRARVVRMAVHDLSPHASVDAEAREPVLVVDMVLPDPELLADAPPQPAPEPAQEDDQP